MAEQPTQEDSVERLLGILAGRQGAKPSKAGESDPGPPIPSKAETPVQLTPAKMLGDYRIVREIGRGGMGIVYECEQLSLGRRVALKVMMAPSASEMDLERFRREARAAARLHHSNIVPVFETGTVEGTRYFAMQFIDGQPLNIVVKGMRQSALASAGMQPDQAAPTRTAMVKPKDPVASARLGADDTELYKNEVVSQTADLSADSTGCSEAAEQRTSSAAESEKRDLRSYTRHDCRFKAAADIARQVALALAYAHARGIVHRDIKPANLLIDNDGVVWVADFGLAKAHGETLTGAGNIVGTLRYMAPERFEGNCDARADIYALGLTLYELLVYRPVFEGTDIAQLIMLINDHRLEQPRSVDPSIPVDLEAIIRKATQKDPGKRYPSAGAMAEDLRRFIADEPILARRSSLHERWRRWRRRNPAVAFLATALLLSLAGGAGVAWYWAYQASIKEDEALRLAALAQSNATLAHSNAALARSSAEEAERRRADTETASRELRLKIDELRDASYRSHIHLAQQALGSGGRAQAAQLLEECIPDPGESDLRGFEWFYLNSARRTERLILRGHVAKIADLDFSLNRDRLATASGDGTVKVWDLADGRELDTLRGKGTGVRCVRFSTDGTKLVSGHADGAARIWDLQSGKVSAVLKGHGAPVYRAAFSADGRRVFTASADATLKTWDAMSGKELSSLPAPEGAGNNLILSPAGERAAGVVDADGSFAVWETANGRRIFQGQKADRLGRGFAFSSDGKKLAQAGTDGSVIVWDALQGQRLQTLRGHTSAVVHVAFSADGKQLASASQDLTARVWDLEAEKEVFRADGLQGTINPVAMSPDGSGLAVVFSDRMVHVWDVKRPGAAALAPKDQPRTRLRWPSPDGKRIATITGNVVKLQLDATKRAAITLDGHGDRVNWLAFSQDSALLASASLDGTVKTWDAASGKELLTFKGHRDRVLCVDFSPDGSRLVSASTDGTAIIWQAETASILRVLEPPGALDPLHAVAFSPDGRQIATGGVQGRLRLWDAAGGEMLRTFVGHRGVVAAMAFSPDGSRLASAASDQTVRLWDTHSGKELLMWASDNVVAIWFGADGADLTGWSKQGLVAWEIGNNPLLRPLMSLRFLDERLAKTPADRPARQARASICAVLARWDQAAADLTELRRSGDGNKLDGLFTGWWLASFGADAKQTPIGIPDPTQPAHADFQASVLRPADVDSNGRFDLGTLPNVCAVTWLHVSGPTDLPVSLGPGLNPRLWLNGKLIHDGNEAALPAWTVPTQLNLSLRDGWNTLIVQPVTRSEADFLALRFGE